MLDVITPLPTSILAFATTVHAAMVALRKHRTPAGSFPWAVLPSLTLLAGPWIFSTAVGVGAGLLVHLTWFIVCELLVPMPRAAARPAVARAALPPSPPSAQPSRPQPHSALPPEPPVRRNDFLTVPVLAVYDETPTIRTFRLARPQDFPFAAGQFVTVRVQVDGKPQVRCYSISSAPEISGYVEISVKRQGLVSGTLHSVLKPGSQLAVRPPAGKFVYPASDDRPVVLLAGGVGITPLMSMLRHGVAADPGRSMTLLYSVRGEAEVAFYDELRLLSRRHPHVRYLLTATGESAPSSCRAGRITAALVREVVPEAAHSIFMLCGPLDMIDGLTSALAGMGVPPAQIRSEVFQASAAIGAVTSPALPPVAATPARSATAARTLELVKSDRRVIVGKDQTLLDAAEGAGVEIPSLCRAGVCGTCRTRLVAGDVDFTSDALDARDRADGYVLPCVTWARGDCSLEA